MQIIVLFLLIIITLILLVVIFGALFYAIDIFLDLPYVATKKDKVKTIEKLAQIKKGEIAIDLGSGDGRLLLMAAKSGAKATGYEINPYLVMLTKIKAKINGFNNVSVLRKSLWNADLKKADVVFVYGRGETMAKFEKFVFKNANKGTKIIVNSDLTKPFPNKVPILIENGIYKYIK